MTGNVARLQISATEVRNATGAAVTQMKLGWFISRQSEPDKILLKGETPAVFPLRLASGDHIKIDIPVVAFADVYRPLVVDGQLNGSFVVEVAVTEAQFSDDTQWKAAGVPAIIKK